MCLCTNRANVNKSQSLRYCDTHTTTTTTPPTIYPLTLIFRFYSIDAMEITLDSVFRQLVGSIIRFASNFYHSKRITLNDASDDVIPHIFLNWATAAAVTSKTSRERKKNEKMKKRKQNSANGSDHIYANQMVQQHFLNNNIITAKKRKASTNKLRLADSVRLRFFELLRCRIGFATNSIQQNTHTCAFGRCLCNVLISSAAPNCV